MDDTLEARLAAVERAVTGSDAPISTSDDAATGEDVAALCETVDDLTDRVAELEAELQAVRGYVGGVRAVDESIERRADLALATARRAADADADAAEDALEVERLAADPPVDDAGPETAVRTPPAADGDAPGYENDDRPSLAARLRDVL